MGKHRERCVTTPITLEKTIANTFPFLSVVVPILARELSNKTNILHTSFWNRSPRDMVDLSEQV